MSDNEDLLGDDLGDHSLADYNLGNDEEDQLLADDYEGGASQNVPTTIPSYGDSVDMVSNDYPSHEIQYNNQPIQYQMQPDTECVVPNITVEVPNTSLPDHSTYAPYEPPHVFESEHAVVPPPIPASPLESPQIVPSEMPPSLAAEPDMGGARERFISERPPGAQRLPQVRDIPDSLDQVVVPRGGGRTWRSAQFAARFHHHQHHNNPYRRNNMHRGNFNQRPSFPPPQMRPNTPQNPPQIRLEIPPEIRPEIRLDLPPQMGPEISPERPILPNMPLEQFRVEMRPFTPRFPQFRPDEPRNFSPNMRPNFERPMFYPQRPPFRPFGPPIREVAPNSINHLPQVTLRHPMPGMPGPKGPMVREPEVRMLPVQLPPNLPPGGLAGKKVLINPHFKGNFQPPVDGPIKDIDDAAERFIAEQRNALARAAQRKFPRRSPQRYIENTTIEIENELAPRRDDADLLRRQEEFINANRAGLRRRMRSPTPPRRSPSPRRSPDRVRARVDTNRAPLSDEDNEYRRRLREQESLREKVLRAKEVRRRKNAVALHQQNKERDRLEKEKEKELPKLEEIKPEVKQSEPVPKPDTTRKSPENVVQERSPVREAEVNSTCENLTPPRDDLSLREVQKPPSPERNLTPPLPKIKKEDSDDDLDLILDDIDGILSDDDDTGRFKEKSKPEPPKPKQVDLRSKLPPKPADTKKPLRQKIVFHEKEKEERKKKDKSPPPPRRTIVSSSTKTEEAEKKALKAKEKSEASKEKARQKIIFDNKEKEEKEKEESKPPFSNRRVILQRKITQQAKDKSVFTRIEIKTDPSKPNPGIFSRAVRTIGKDSRIIVKKEEPQIEYESESDLDEDKLLEEDVGMIAVVTNLPHGMTDTRMKTLAGNDVQSLNLDKEERSAKITFKTTVAAESFKRKFNNKMVAASRLTVTLR